MKKIFFATLGVALSNPFFALAQTAGGTSQNSSVVDTPSEVIRTIENIGNWIFSIFLIIAVIMIIIAAFQMLFASGDTDKFNTGKRALVYAIAAVAVAVLAKGIIYVVQSVLITS